MSEELESKLSRIVTARAFRRCSLWLRNGSFMAAISDFESNPFKMGDAADTAIAVIESDMARVWAELYPEIGLVMSRMKGRITGDGLGVLYTLTCTIDTDEVSEESLLVEMKRFGYKI